MLFVILRSSRTTSSSNGFLTAALELCLCHEDSAQSFTILLPNSKISEVSEIEQLASK